MSKDTGCCNWNTNPYPHGLELDTMSEAVKRAAKQLNLARVPIVVVNGFCFMFKKSLINAIGSFDKVNFPVGYGEEVDFSLRAHSAGYKAYVVPSVYLYHEKTASFTEASKKKLKEAANRFLKQKYVTELKNANKVVESMTSPQLQPLRNLVSFEYNAPDIVRFQQIHKFSVVFLYDAKSAQYDILRVQLNQINALLSFGMKVSIGVDQDAKPIFLRNIRLLNFNTEGLQDIIHFHPNTMADPEFLMSLKFNKFVASHNIIVGHSCELVSKLIELSPNWTDTLIVYQLNDQKMQKVDQFNTVYHNDLTDSCMSTVVRSSIQLVASSESNANSLSKIYTTQRLITNGPILDQNVYYRDEMAMKIRSAHAHNTEVSSENNFGGSRSVRSKQVTFFFSSSSYSLQSTANFILDVAYELLQLDSWNFHIAVANFGPEGTADTFQDHLSLKQPVAKTSLNKMKFLQNSQKFHFFSGNEQKYGGLLRKSNIFVDATHGHFSEQRILEAMACGALVITGTDDISLCKSNSVSVSDICVGDKFLNPSETVSSILSMTDYKGPIFDDIMKQYSDISQKYRNEPTAVKWAVELNDVLVSHRVNHIGASGGIVLR